MQSPLRHGKAAIGTTIAGGALAALSQAPDGPPASCGTATRRWR